MLGGTFFHRNDDGSINNRYCDMVIKHHLSSRNKHSRVNYIRDNSSFSAAAAGVGSDAS